jgi:hypothetical protein
VLHGRAQEYNSGPENKESTKFRNKKIAKFRNARYHLVQNSRQSSGITKFWSSEFDSNAPHTY